MGEEAHVDDDADDVEEAHVDEDDFEYDLC